MLKQRILTAVVLVPLLLLLVFAGPHWLFTAVIAAVLLGAAWEWTQLMHCTSRAGRYLFILAAAVAMLGSLFLAAELERFLPVLMAVALAWWIGVLAWLSRRPSGQPGRGTCPFKGVCGLLTLVPAFVALAWLHETGPWYLVYLLALVWLADVGAYFAGHRFGRRKLAPQVSPGKTWEGVGGAFGFAAVVVAAGWFGGLVFGPAWFFVLASLLTVAVSIVGDLSESMFKRQQGLKDSGTLLPGHGGLLDRIDSLTSAAPFLVAGMLLAEHLFMQGPV